jgi:arginyl-tRNA synthetase
MTARRNFSTVYEISLFLILSRLFMNIIEKIQQSFIAFIAQTFGIDQTSLPHGIFTLNTDEQKQDFGAINSNIAMILAKQLGKPPRDIAQQIIQDFKNEYVQKVEIAGPGFLNFFLTPAAFQKLAQELYTQKETFFKPDSSTFNPKTFNVEFVSANPTGPLHLGHGRGGIIGDVLCNVLNFVGHKAIAEFYINDAGSQMQKLGQSFKARCMQALGKDAQVPEEGYHGEYLIELAKECIAKKGEKVLGEPDEFFVQYAEQHMLEQIKKTLADYGIAYDVWFSEKTLHKDGSIARAIDLLEQKGFIYEKDGALWFKSTEFGDDKDRVVRKADGNMTYVAADIAYMKNKIDRGAQHLVIVLGHDHHGYVARLQALLKALDLPTKDLDAILYQLVKMKASGQLVRMSKRAGNIVTLRDVIDMVGADVARFFYLNRKADAQLEFDLDLALKKTEENPVFYVQYAYVRTGSILNKAAEVDTLQNIAQNDLKNIGSNEQFLLIKISSLKNLLQNISTNYQTHVLTYYALELAQAFHAYYAKNRVIDLENIPQSRARLCMVMLLRNTLETVLKLLEISRPEKM